MVFTMASVYVIVQPLGTGVRKFGKQQLKAVKHNLTLKTLAATPQRRVRWSGSIM
jgi:hypothetical protein